MSKQCGGCESVFNTHARFKTHLSKSHGGKEHSWICRICREQMPTEASFGSHKCCHQIPLGSSELQTWSGFEQKFYQLDMEAMLLLISSWLRTIDLTKRVTHPYTTDAAPDYWPRIDKVRHVEIRKLKESGKILPR